MIRLKFSQLGKKRDSQEDNEKDSWHKIKAKLEEEFNELVEAIEEKNIIHIAEEVQDVIQICIRIFAMLRKDNKNLEQLNMMHNKKIADRGWKEVNKIYMIWIK